VKVVPSLGREGQVYWLPWNIVISQDHVTFTVEFEDILVGLSGAFCGLIYQTMDGFIHLPDEIDVSRPFKICYSAAEVSLGPLDR
jgi:hypothetical protein